MERLTSRLPVLKDVTPLDYVVGLDIDGGIAGKPKTKKIKLASLQSFFGSIGSGIVRDSASLTTPQLAKNISHESLIDIAKSFSILQVSSTVPAWIRLYSKLEYQIADRERRIDIDATGEHGLILEVITGENQLSLSLAPLVTGCNLEDVPSLAIPITVTNLNLVSVPITVNLDCLILEP